MKGTNLCKLQLHLTILAKDSFRECPGSFCISWNAHLIYTLCQITCWLLCETTGAGRVTFMWLTTIIHTGKCMPLVGVQTQPSTARGTDILPRLIHLQKRCRKQPTNIISCIFWPQKLVLTWDFVSLWFELTGNQESGHRWKRMEGLELEVRRWPAAKWCLFHPLWCRCFSQLLESVQSRS